MERTPSPPCGIVKVNVDALSPQGEGLAFIDGFTCFIPDALPGERVRVRLGKPFVKGSRRLPGQIVDYVKQSEERVAPFCAHYGACGGCMLQQASYQLQLKLKQADIATALATCGIKDPPLLPLQGCTTRPCRFKTIRHFALNAQGKLISGFYQARSHALVALTHCPLEPQWMGDFAAAFTKAAHDAGLSAYDEVQGTGCLRALMLREGDVNERMAVIVHAATLPESFLASLKALGRAHGITCLALSCNQRRGNQVLGASTVILDGNSVIYKSYGNLRFACAPLAFMQVNHEICAKLYAAAVGHCGRGQRALDLCCGSGTMSLLLAKNFSQVQAVEVVPEAVAAAQANARLNQLTQVDFVCADMGDFLRAQRRQGQKIDALIADPARVGLGADNCQAIAALPGPFKAAFIFCSLTALKRDVPILLQQGLQLDALQGFDMFPYSSHVETLVLMHKP